MATLTDLQARDPQQCYRFLFPAVAGPAGSGASVALPPGTAGPTLRHVLGPAEPAAAAPPTGR